MTKSQDLYLVQHVETNTKDKIQYYSIFSSLKYEECYRIVLPSLYKPGMINNVDMGEFFGYGHKFYSDHRIITCDIVAKSPMHIDNRRVYDFKNVNIEGAISIFNKINWSQMTIHMNIHKT